MSPRPRAATFLANATNAEIAAAGGTTLIVAEQPRDATPYLHAVAYLPFALAGAPPRRRATH